ncbi:MAG: BTAD domain-containing putative transcriptional regulator, partial [Ilumatobacteraceae bacterium]
DDLRFRTWEADRLFREHYDMILGPADVAMLITRTEGWAAGLQLYRLAARHQPLDARRRLIGELSATRVGRDYLARNVLSGLPSDLQSFLLDTAALPVLTGPLCDQVTGRSDSIEVLEHLEHHQLFTIAIDQRGTYRYHEVLRAHLDACLQQRRGGAGAAAHHRRIGQLLESQGLVVDALHAFSRAGDWTAVRRLVVDRLAAPDVAAGPIVGDAWIELVPAPIVENDPYLLLARARERTVNGRFAAAMRDYDRAGSGAATDALARICADERAELVMYTGRSEADAGQRIQKGADTSGWLADLRRVAQASDLEAVTDFVAAGGAVSSEGSCGAHLRADLVRAVAALVVGQTTTAHSLLSDVVRHPRADSRVAAMAELGLVVTEAMSAYAAGTTALAPTRVDHVVSILERCGLGWAARVARAALAMTTQSDGTDAALTVRQDCQRDADMWGTALAALFEALGHARDGGDPSASFDASLDALAAVGATSLQSMVVRLRVPTTTPVVTGVDARVGPPVRVHCFDALELTIDHRRVDLSAVRPRALSVLRLLALHAGRAVHCETLMDSLWPDVEPDAARHSLHVAVSSLRKAMPTGSAAAIVRHGDAYRLELSPDDFCDVRDFRRSLASATTASAQGHLERALQEATRAVDLYRGDLLLDEGPADWVVGPRESLRLDMIRACVIGGDAAMQLGSFHAASRVAERGLAVDRYADPLWRILIDALERSSDVASADRIRRSWQEMMDELGVA